MPIRPFDKKIDKFYSPDATPELYLTESMVLNFLNNIPEYEDDSEKAARKLIIKVEVLNRDEKMGKISTNKSVQENKNLANKYLAEFGFWPYVSKTYSQFYETLSS